MAASPAQPANLEVADLRAFRADDLRPLLDEQSRFWNSLYRWDFDASRDVILRFIDMRNLYGYSLLSEGRLVGYSYFVHEHRKALIGDLFISESHRTEQAEHYLLYNTLHAAAAVPGVNRIEGQLLALSFDPTGEVVRGRRLAVHERLFMMMDDFRELKAGPAGGSAFRYLPWSENDLDATAELICRSYENHVDSLINDQYRSLAGARRFLFNSTQHPGCGIFFRRGALSAIEPLSRMLCGICLGSLVRPRVGHITQLCVAPFARGKGIGYELLRRAGESFQAYGCDAVSLTVTSSNAGAVQLYERLGFSVLRRFFAFVWETP
jgi:ribosomal protein S18 acetylase RimI-like enzyme